MKNYESLSAKELLLELKKAKQDLIKSKKIMDKKDEHIYPIKETPFEIPENWEWAYLSDVSIVQEGPGIRKHQYAESGIQFLTVTNILEGSVDLEKSKKYISINEYKEKYLHYTINKGDIVNASSGATWGKSAIFEGDEKLMLNTSTLRLRFYNDICDNRYLYYLTKSTFFKTILSSHSTGQQDNYGYSHYSIIPIPIPPLKEQKQIVAILDEAFEAIDKAKANIEKNIENAKELANSNAKAIFEKYKSKSKSVKIGDIVALERGHNPPKKVFINQPKEGYVRFYQIRDGASDDYVVYVPDNGKLHKVKEDEILMVAYRHVGRAFRGVNGAFNVALCKITNTSKNILDDDYLFELIPSDFIRGELLKRSERSLIPSMSVTHLAELEIPLPSLTIQKEIMHSIKQFKEATDRMIELYITKLKNIDELKKSILQKAFAGELIENKIEV